MLTLVDEVSGIVQGVYQSYYEIAKSLGIARVSPKAKYTKGYLIIRESMDWWKSGYILRESEREYLGLASSTYSPPSQPKVCSRCHKELPSHYYVDCREICKVCAGTHEVILGSLVKRKIEPMAITDGTTTYSSILEAAESIGGNLRTVRSAIYRCLIGSKKSYLGTTWEYVKEPLDG